MVYWLGHPTLVQVMVGSNPIRNPLLPAKAVDRQPSDDCFERTTRWVPCADGIKLQSLRSVRFWTSLVRKNCHNISRAIELCWQLAIGKASLFGAGLDISMSRQLKTKKSSQCETFMCIILIHTSSSLCQTKGSLKFCQQIS